VPAPIDLGAIVRAFDGRFVRAQRLTLHQRKVLRAIADCRTPALGGERQRCDRCGREHIQWRSCGNRHCPRCQSAARQTWLARRTREILPAPYFHVVFTVPEQLNIIAVASPRLFYDALFRAVSTALLDLGVSRLRARIGAMLVLHTWGQTLVLHPHIHCVVPAIGRDLATARWRVRSNARFFLPVKPLSRRFRTLFCNALRRAFRSGKFVLDSCPDATAFDTLLANASHTDWVVYCKAPFGGPAQVLAYLSSYTHHTAISNRRILGCDGTQVTFLYRDYAHGNVARTMTLHADEFLRRFLLHVLPPRLVRIRYAGFLANRTRTAAIAAIRATIPNRTSLPDPQPPAATSHLCPECHEGTMIAIARIDPDPTVRFEDSS
jgi:hypothetical protein